MRAIQITETGGPEVLRLAELPDPQPGPGELLIEVAAAGVNYIDTYHRSGAYSRQLPFVLGTEGAGTVTRRRSITASPRCARVGRSRSSVRPAGRCRRWIRSG